MFFGQCSAVGVVGGRAVAPPQKGFQPVHPYFPKLLHVVKAVAAAENGAERDGKNVRQIVIHRGDDARIRHFLQNGDQADELCFRDVC
jgi:hypothetical protein